MCSPAELETALRGLMRKESGVDCVSIAIDASSFSPGGVIECGLEPIQTRIIRSILDGRLLVQSSSETDETALGCNDQEPVETILHRLIVQSIEDDGVNVWPLLFIADPVNACPEDCDDDAVGLAERIKGSVRVNDGFSDYSLAVVESDGTSALLDCHDMTPTETLLKSAFVRQANGLWAMRVVLEL